MTTVAQAKGGGGSARRFRDFWQWLGISGDALGTGGTLRAAFSYSWGIAAAVVAVVVTLNIVTRVYEFPQEGVAGPVIWEVSRGLSLMVTFPLIWMAYRLLPPLTTRPRWWLLLHLPLAILFGLSHVLVFIVFRKLAYAAGGEVYDFGPFLPQYLYEQSKDFLSYALCIGGFSVVEHMLRQRAMIVTPGQTLTFDIRDGAKLTRVRLDQVLAIASAGNYVEFVLSDGRRLLMRSPLSALEDELSPRGFLRTHRSWLVNAKQMTALKPEGSGDYEVELGAIKVPLSRRFPDALAKLREGS